MSTSDSGGRVRDKRPHAATTNDILVGQVLDELEYQSGLLERIADRLDPPTPPAPATVPMRVSEPAPAPASARRTGKAIKEG